MSSLVVPPRGLPSRVELAWRLLLDETAARASNGRDRVLDLPPAARRWLARAISPEAAPARAAVLSMHGQIRIGRWRPFYARQVIDPASGFIWAATAGRWPLVVRGFDRFSGGDGEMRWRLLGVIPVMSAIGADVSRSAAGRLAVEMIMCPSAALAPNVAWRPGDDDDQAVADISVDGSVHTLTIAVDAEGRLLSARLPRWGSPDGQPYRLHTFGVVLDGEISANGYTISASVRAGWWDGENGRESGEFFRATIDEVTFR